VIRFTPTIIFVLCLCQGIASAQTEAPDSLPDDVPISLTLFPPSYSQFEDTRKLFDQPTTKIFSLDLVPKFVELKGLYMEKRQDGSALTGALSDPSPLPSKWGRYFDILASSSQFDGKLIGESEFAYSTLGVVIPADQKPTMSRLGLRGSWSKASYGLFYRSFGNGFISTNGLKVDRARDENEMWGEYDFQLFRLRTTFAEWREKNSPTSQLTLTRTAATSLNLNRPSWNASLSSSYSLIGQGPAQPSYAFTHGFTVAYRPVSFLTIQPNVSFKDEWDQISGLRTDTPSGGLSLVGTPYPDVQLIGRASYANGMSQDPLKINATINTAAGLNWKLGRSPLGEQSLSFQVEYQRQSYAHAATNAPANLTGTVQLKIVGF
jgi:hypothetical protein